MPYLRNTQTLEVVFTEDSQSPHYRELKALFDSSGHRPLWEEVSAEQAGVAAGADPAGSGGSGSPTGAAGGDLAGTYPNPTVPGLATEVARAEAAEALLIPLTQRAAANGVATLDGSGKLPASQLTVDALEYKGTWNANTNSPALSNGSGSPGDFYIVSTGGSGGPVTAAAGDYVILNPSLVWEDIPVGATGRVASFNTRTGAVTLSKADVTGTGLAAADVSADASGAASTAQAAAIAASAQALVRTAVKTANYTAAAGDAVQADISGGSFTVTLPTAPADRTRIAVKVITISGTAGSTTLTIARGGADVFNKAGGSTSLSLTALFQGVVLQYDSGSAIWTVQSTDTPLGSALGAAKLGSDGNVGGPSGSPLLGAVGPTNFVSKTANYTAVANDFVEADVSGGGFTVTLPTAPAVGAQVAVKKVDSSANTLTIAAGGGGTVDGSATTTTTTQWAGLILEHKGSNVWRVAASMATTGPTGPTGLGFGSVVAKVANYTIVSGDNGTVLTFNGSSLTATLPPAAPASPWMVTVINLNATALTVSPNGLNLNGSASSITLAQNQGVFIWSDGTNYEYSTGPKGATGATGSGGNFVVPAVSPKSGNFFTCSYLKGSGTSNADGVLYAIPIVPGAAITLAELHVKVSSAGGTGSTVRVGVYADNGSAYPGALLLDAGAIASGTSTGILAKTGLSQVLSAGVLYWLVGVAQSQGVTAPTMVASATWASQYQPFGDPNANAGFLFSGTYNGVIGYSMTGVSGALPGTFSATVTPLTGNGGILVVGKVA